RAVRQSFPTRRAADLSLSGPDCGSSYARDCTATGGLRISASNPILTDPSYEKKVRITPEVPDLKVTVAGGIHLAGKFRGLGTYRSEGHTTELQSRGNL